MVFPNIGISLQKDLRSFPRKGGPKSMLGNRFQKKILKFWSRLPEIRISYDFEVPVLPRSGDFGLPKTFLDSWTWFSDFLGEADIRIAKISVFLVFKMGFFGKFSDHFWVIFWSLKTPLRAHLRP